MNINARGTIATTLSALLALAPMPALARDVAPVLKTGVVAANVVLPNLPATQLPAMGNTAVPSLVFKDLAPVQIRNAQLPGASAQALKAVELPSALKADATPGAMKTEAAIAFDASGTALIAAEPVALAVEPAASPVLSASTGKSASLLKSVPSPRAASFKAKARKYLPAAAAVAVSAGLGILAHMSGQMDAGLAAMAAALPLVAGSLSNRASPETKFRAALQSVAVPGESIAPQKIVTLAAEAGLPMNDAVDIIASEAANGRAARFSNGLIVRLDLDADKEEGHAKRAINDGLSALAEKDKPVSEMLPALGRLAVARDRAAVAGSENAASIERQLQVLRNNFAFEILRKIAAQPNVTVSADSTQYLNGLSYDVLGAGTSQAKLATALELTGILNRVLPAPGADQETNVGVRVLRTLFESLMPERGQTVGATSKRSTLEDVRKSLDAYMVAGFEVTKAVKEQISEDLSLKPEIVEGAVRTLAANNWLVRAGVNEFIYTGVPAYMKKAPAAADAPERKAVVSAMAGLRHVNGASIVEHALAERAFGEALELVQKGSIEQPWGDFAQEVAMLRRNAMVKLVSDVIALYEPVLREDPERSDDHARALQWKRWLANGFESHDRDQPLLERGMRGWLVDVLNTLRPTLKTQRAAAHGEAVAAAISATASYIGALKSAEDVKLLPASASGEQQVAKPGQPAAPGYPLIAKDDKNYKALNEFGTNITAAAARGEFEPLVGRRKEMRQMIKVLMRGKKNNPIVAGEAGVGKTAMVEGLSQLLVHGSLPATAKDPELKLPDELKGKNVFRLNLQALVAGTTLRGQFEERLNNVLKEVVASKGKVVLFVDEVHMLLGLGSAEGAHDAAETLLEYMARPGFSMIGATTLDMFRKIEKKGALNRRFGLVMLQPPTVDDAVEILMSAKKTMEKVHNVTISEATVKTAVQMAARFVTDRHLPDSALDLLDDAATEVQLKASEARHKGQAEVRDVTKDDIGAEIALRLDIPAANMTGDEREKLKALPARLTARVIGQDDAVQSVSKAVRRAKLGYKDPNQPDMFVFLGPTGVGKTELVKALAEDQFGDAKAMTRIDMSEYQEKHNIARLIGAPPGYVGYEEGGKLTEAVRRKPYQVILLDEIDKAHPDVWNLLLQIKEDGRLTDGNGRTVDFKNVIIIATANYKGQHSQEEKKGNPLGFVTLNEKKDPAKGKSEEEKAARKKQYIEDFREAVRPETFGRIGDRNIIAFNELESAHYEKIARLREADLNKRLAHKNMKVTLTENAIKQILLDADTPENRRYGARPLKQTVEDEVVEALVEADLEGQIGEGDSVIVDYDAAAKAWVAKKVEAKN